ncbi:MAG: Gfo/Idh/MocA family oxidoreductase [Planctomycetes bacterium]|nr:Gfo/Idh/MocA family oxidoreductase [Planctomycetota bacterium]
MSLHHPSVEPHATAPRRARPRGAPSSVTRRQWLRRAAAAGAVAAAAPWIVPGSALGLSGSVPASERIVAGGIGIRRRGGNDLRWMLPEKDVQFVAICDAQKESRETVKRVVDNHYGSGDCAMYADLGEFLAERTDIDVVLIATGDRWHALASILAMRAGKDIYTEKPSCMTIAEGRAVVETARRYGRVYQTGTQRLSIADFVFCYEMVRLGRLGKVHTARAHIAPWDAAVMETKWLPAEPEPPRDQVNWDLWLGPCPWRPYNKTYVGGGWRGQFDFHTSCIGEWGAHTFAQAQHGLGLTHTAPVAYHYVDNDSGDGMVTEFATGAKMILERDLKKKIFHGSCGMRFEGPEGWVAAGDGYAKPDVSHPSLLADYKKIVDDYVARTGNALNHMRNLLDCVKSRRQTVANPEVMHRSMTAVHAANICMWLKRDLRYDPVKEEFVGDAEANRLRSRAMREPWII